jgi:hypothetical protein
LLLLSMDLGFLLLLQLLPHRKQGKQTHI